MAPPAHSPTIYGTGVTKENGYHVYPNADKCENQQSPTATGGEVKAKEYQEAAILKPKGVPNYRYADHFAGVERV